MHRTALFLMIALLLSAAAPAHCLRELRSLVKRGAPSEHVADWRPLLTKLPGWIDDGQVTITPVGGGMTNKVFVASNGGGQSKVLIRLGGADAALFGIDRRAEWKVLKEAARVGAGAQPLLALPHKGILITKWIEGKVLTPETARQDETLPKVVNALHDVHQRAQFPGKFSIFDSTREMSDKAAKLGCEMPTEFAEAMKRVARIEKALAGYTRRTAIHNDLHPGNIILDERGDVKFIDWEFGTTGDPYIDLGSLAHEGKFDEQTEKHLLMFYHGGFTPAQLAHLKLMRLMTAARFSAWGYLRSRSTEPALPEPAQRAYAKGKLDEFLAGTNGPEFESLLAAAGQPHD